MAIFRMEEAAARGRSGAVRGSESKTGRSGEATSSDGQRFKAGGKAESTGHINPKYGAEPGRMFYTHISDQYAPFSAKVVIVGVCDATYVLDGYFTTSLICASRSTTPILPVLQIMSLPSCIC
jgi:TnpA family transposase